MNLIYEFFEIFSRFGDIGFKNADTLRWLYFLAPFLIFALLHIGRQRKMFAALDCKYSALNAAFTALLLIGASAFFIMSLAEPYLERKFVRPVWKREAVDFVIDLSLSQNARDVSPSRLEAAKMAVIEAAEIMGSEGVGNFCLGFFTVKFGRMLECTNDLKNFKEIIKRMNTFLAGGIGGTNLLAAIPPDYEMIKKEILPEGARITLFLITDGGKEMERNEASGAFEILEPDWNEDALKAKIDMLLESGVRVIPVGVGGSLPAQLDISGKTYFTLLDEEIIKKIALWAGFPERYFIIGKGSDFPKWASAQIIGDREAVEYLEEPREIGLWRMFLLIGAFFSAAGIFVPRILRLAGRNLRKRQ